LNYYAGGGVGLKINFTKFYLFSEIIYLHPLNTVLEKSENRYNQPSLWTEGWMDSDFRIIHTSLRIGIVKSFHRVKKIE